MGNFETLYLAEIDYLKQLAKIVAEENTALADVFSENHDPDVQRLFEGFAFLTARLQHTLADSFPEITHNLLQQIFPQALAPLPSATVVQFASQPGKLPSRITIPAGFRLKTAAGPDPVPYQTHAPLTIEPVRLLRRKLFNRAEHTDIHLTFRYEGKDTPWQPQCLSFFLHPDAAVAATLTLWLDCHLEEVLLHVNDGRAPISLDGLSTWQPSATNLVLPFGNGAFWPLSLLLEHFYLPHVHDFMHLDLQPLNLSRGKGREFTVILRFDGALPLSEQQIEQAFLLHCVPAVNRFISQQTLPPPEKRSYYDLTEPEHALLQLIEVQTAKEPLPGRNDLITLGNIATAHLPQTPLGTAGDQPPLFYHLSRQINELGQPVERVQLYSAQGKPSDTLPSAPLLCHAWRCHKNVQHITANTLQQEDERAGNLVSARNLVAASPYWPALVDSARHWPLLSLMNTHLLHLADAASLRQALASFDFHPEHDRPRHRDIRQHLDGISHLVARPVDRLSNASLRRGLEIQLTLDPRCYQSLGEMYAFGRVLAQVFSLWQSKTSFVSLLINNQASGEQWQLDWVDGQRHAM